MSLTEFEKTVLLSLFILAKGSTKKYTPLELLLSKFPIRHRKMVKQYLEKLVAEKYIGRKDDGYRIEKPALRDISGYLIRGPRVRL